MSERVLFRIGAIGEIIKRIQQALTDIGFDPNGVDGWYGKNTASAVRSFQESMSLPLTGSVDEDTWQQLMKCSVPLVSERSLQVTASFEGHGFGLAMGNFDGALLTWGIIGFTMASGEVQSIVKAINRAHPQIIQDSFQSSTDELLKLMRSSSAFQKTWADQHTLDNGSLMQPWREMFARLGAYPEVQAEQMKRVKSDYMQPAISTAKELKFSSELGLALCFDIHVQNGRIKEAAWEQIERETRPNMPEADLRAVVANAVADNARQAYREDVRKRKMTLATGQGIVHGYAYALENWGLSGQWSAEELTSSSAQAAA